MATFRPWWADFAGAAACRQRGHLERPRGHLGPTRRLVMADSPALRRLVAYVTSGVSFRESCAT